MRIILPFPVKELNPNYRIHYRGLAKVKKAARTGAWVETAYALKSGSREHYAGEFAIPMRVLITPPDRRLRDQDNMIAMLKSALDGIADGLQVNDNRFNPTFVFNPPAKPGRIEVLL